MEELIQLTKRQLKLQKIISACLAVMVVVLLAGGVVLVGNMQKMAQAMEDVAQKVQEIDVESINDTISETQKMLDSVDDFSSAVDAMTTKVEDFGSWLTALLGQ